MQNLRNKIEEDCHNLYSTNCLPSSLQTEAPSLKLATPKKNVENRAGSYLWVNPEWFNLILETLFSLLVIGLECGHMFYLELTRKHKHSKHLQQREFNAGNFSNKWWKTWEIRQVEEEAIKPQPSPRDGKTKGTGSLTKAQWHGLSESLDSLAASLAGVAAREETSSCWRCSLRERKGEKHPSLLCTSFSLLLAPVCPDPDRNRLS